MELSNRLVSSVTANFIWIKAVGNNNADWCWSITTESVFVFQWQIMWPPFLTSTTRHVYLQLTVIDNFSHNCRCSPTKNRLFILLYTTRGVTLYALISLVTRSCRVYFHARAAVYISGRGFTGCFYSLVISQRMTVIHLSSFGDVVRPDDGPNGKIVTEINNLHGVSRIRNSVEHRSDCRGALSPLWKCCTSAGRSQKSEANDFCCYWNLSKFFFKIKRYKPDDPSQICYLS